MNISETNAVTEDDDGFISILDLDFVEDRYVSRMDNINNSACQCRECHTCFKGDCEYLKQ